MAVDTLRANKMRSALTILGVVIGITSIVSMTALIRGFDESFKDLFRQVGPSTMFIQKFGFVSFSQGKQFRDLIKRPNLSIADADAIEASPLIQTVAIQVGGGPASRQERMTYGNNATKRMVVIGATANFGTTNSIPLEGGRIFTESEVERRRMVIILGNAPARALFPNTDPIGKKVRAGKGEYTVVGVYGKRPNPLGGSQADEFAVVPWTSWQKVYGADGFRIFGIVHRDVTIIAIPREGVPQADAIREVEEIMRARHGLRLDQESDFDIGTQDALFKFWDQLSSAVFLALVVISSIALMVGGIGVMGDHDHQRHRAHARDWRPQGARRATRRGALAVPARGRVPHLGRRRHRHRVRRRHRLADQRALRLPDLHALVVVRHRSGLLGLGRHLLWHLPCLQGRPHGPDRSPSVRVKAADDQGTFSPHARSPCLASEPVSWPKFS